MEIRVDFLLSQRGQKDAIVKGHDAKEKQSEVFTIESISDIGKKILAYASIMENGEIRWSISSMCDEYFLDEDGEEKYEPFFMNEYPESILPIFTAYEKREQQKKAYREKLAKKDEEYREKLIRIFQEKGIEGIREEFTGYTVCRKLEEYDLPEISQALADKEKAEAKREEESREAEVEKRREEKDEKEVEKEIWVEKFGSAHLKEAVKMGYNATRKYFQERAEKEISPDAKVDFNDDATWDNRSCPSQKALDIVKELQKKGIEATVKWGYLQEEEDEECEKHEILVIENFLNEKDVMIEM